MKILMVGPSQKCKGGMTTVVNNILQSEFAQLVDIKYMATTIDGNILLRLLYNFQAFIRILVSLIFNSYEIVHIHMASRGSFYRKSFIVNISKILNKKIIIHLHGACFEEFYEKESNSKQKKYISKTFQKVDKVIVLGDRWKNFIKNIAPQANIEVFNNSVKVPEYTVSWNEDKINILFLGVLTKRKGIYDLIEAIKILNDKEIVREKKLNFIIGGSGKEEVQIKELISKYKLEQCTEMVGWVNGEKKEELLKKSQLSVLPSYNEGLPMAILEAMSYGIPVISTDVGSISEVVKDNETGFLIKPGEAESLAKAIIKVINLEEVWKVQSMTCKELIYAKFNEEEYFNEIKKLYNTLLK